MSRRIPLTRGKVAIVDNKYYDALVAMGKWCFCPNANGYAWKRRSGKGKQPSITMHQVVLILAGVGRVKFIDHRDRNGLNNRRRNLRPVTRQQNNRNVGKRKDNTSGFKGVGWHSTNRKWQAQISVNRRIVYLGSFDNRRQAARAYDRAAKKHFGRFAFLNFPRA